MINRNNRRINTPSFVWKWSDEDVIRSVLKTELWRLILMGRPQAMWIMFRAVFNLKVEMFVAPQRAVLRVDHGQRTTGIFITIMSTIMMIGFNSNTIFGIIATALPLGSPILPFIMSGEQITQSTFTHIRSPALMVFWMVYLLISTVHLIRIYRRKKKKIRGQCAPMKRGNSWLYIWIFKRLNWPEHIVQRFIEPLLVFTIGYVLTASNADLAFGIFLMIGALCLFFQEVYDGVSRYIMLSHELR